MHILGDTVSCGRQAVGDSKDTYLNKFAAIDISISTFSPSASNGTRAYLGEKVVRENEYLSAISAWLEDTDELSGCGCWSKFRGLGAQERSSGNRKENAQRRMRFREVVKLMAQTRCRCERRGCRSMARPSAEPKRETAARSFYCRFYNDKINIYRGAWYSQFCPWAVALI